MLKIRRRQRSRTPGNKRVKLTLPEENNQNGLDSFTVRPFLI